MVINIKKTGNYPGFFLALNREKRMKTKCSTINQNAIFVKKLKIINQ